MGYKQVNMSLSSGGNLSCSEIFHAVLCNWDNGQGSAQQVNPLPQRQFYLQSAKRAIVGANTAPVTDDIS